MTQQSPLSSIVKSRRLSLFGHVARMNELTDANRILFVQPPDNWRRAPREAMFHLDSKCLQRPVLIWHGELPEAREAAQNRPFYVNEA